MIAQIPDDEELVSVHGDGAYDTKNCYAATTQRDLLIWKNERPWKENTALARMKNERLRSTKYLKPAPWKKWGGYPQLSLVETKMRYFKLLGERVMDRDFDRQVAELQVRVAILNRFTQLGTPVTLRVA